MLSQTDGSNARPWRGRAEAPAPNVLNCRSGTRCELGLHRLTGVVLVVEHFAQGHVEGVCQCVAVADSKIAFPTLYGTDIGAMQGCSLSEVFLGQPTGDP